MVQIINFVAVLVISLNVFADDLNSTDAEALENTIKLLQSKTERQEVIDKNPDALRADDMAKKLVGEGVDLDEIYEISAEIFRKIATDTKGNSDELVHLIQRAQSDPKAFYQSLSPEHKKMIQEMGANIQKKNPSATPEKP